MGRVNLIIIIILAFLVIIIGVSLTGRIINLNPYTIQEYTTPKNSITINPSEITVHEDKYFTINIDINTEKPIYALSFNVIFDENMIEVVSTEEGDFFKTDDIDMYPSIKTDKSKITFSNTILGQNEGIIGSDTLLNIKFRSLKKGVVKINIENLQIVNSKLQAVTGMSVNGATVEII